MPDLSEKSRFALVDGVFCTLDDKVQATGFNILSTEESVVYLIWEALGILQNGSFQYFFENNMDADGVAKSFLKLRMPVVAECFCLAKNALPTEYSDLEWKQQLKYLQKLDSYFDTLAQSVLAESNRIERLLAEYISTYPYLARLV